MPDKRIGVAGGTAMWRRGVAAVLQEAGYGAMDCEALSDWRPGRGGTAVIVHIEDAEGLPVLEGFTADHPHIPVVAITATLGVTEFAAVIKAGATSAVSEDEPPSLVVATLEHAIAGRASAPPQVMRALAARIAAGFGEALSIDATDTERLRSLAAGNTVAQLAAEGGFSEREMFRLLNDLYARIGVSSRTEAIIWASRYGLLDDSGP